MLSKGHHQQHRSLLRTSNIKDTLIPSFSGTFSPETITTTSSGYSTEDSQLDIKDSCLIESSSVARKQCHCQQQHRSKLKGKKKSKNKKKEMRTKKSKRNKKNLTT